MTAIVTPKNDNSHSYRENGSRKGRPFVYANRRRTSAARQIIHRRNLPERDSCPAEAEGAAWAPRQRQQGSSEVEAALWRGGAGPLAGGARRRGASALAPSRRRARAR